MTDMITTTCIVALVTKDAVVHVAADTLGSNCYSGAPYRTSKLITWDTPYGCCVGGYTSSYRMGQILQHNVEIPGHGHPRMDLDKWVYTALVPTLRKTLKDHGFSWVSENKEFTGTFLFGLAGRLFRWQGDNSVLEPLHPYHAVGCGDHLALGAMYATQETRHTVTERLTIALAAACMFSPGVGAPLEYLSSRNPTPITLTPNL